MESCKPSDVRTQRPNRTSLSVIKLLQQNEDESGFLEFM